VSKKSALTARGAALFGVAALAVTGLAIPASAATPGASLAPTVTHTGKGPTGYSVTFHFYDPSADRVQIKGEWSFSGPADTSATSSAGRLPAQWQPGDFPITHPNTAAADWPVADMKENKKTGVWSWTSPMPSGTFTYNFFRDCATADGTGCASLSDPANAPWNTTGSVEPTSQVYVPADTSFGTVDYSWQAPMAAAKQGRLVDVSYPTTLSTAPAGSHPLAIYTPPGYNPSRKTPYPTLYLSHGGGGQEIDWSTQGAANSIFDHLINSGKIQPTVVVMTDFNDITGGTPGYSTELLQNVVPYVQAHLNVSADADDRAFAGLSAGAARANDLLFNHTASFGYYGVWSGGVTTRPTADQAATMAGLGGIQLGVGNQDPIAHDSTVAEEGNLPAAGVPVAVDNINGGHEWYVWRIELKDFATGTLFRGTTTTAALTRSGRNTVATATVTTRNTTGAKPTGSVRFYLDGRLDNKHLVGEAQLNNAGKAKAGVGNVTGHTVVARYVGDSAHNASTGQIG
jgi:enterochelin esterase-like enzyme